MKTLSIFVFLLLTAISLNSQTVFTVTKTSDPDPFLYLANPDDPAIVGTFQWAMRKANESATPCVIVFAIPISGQQVIYLNNSLPSITNQVTIDGTTQAGYAYSQPTIIIDGQSLINNGINLYNSTGSIIKGIQIRNFFYNNLIIQDCNNVSITDNLITQAQRANPSDAATGLRIMGSVNNTIKGNFIGTNFSGNNLGNVDYGIYISSGSTQSVIGGTSANEANTIAFNGLKGLWLASGNSHRISGNRIYNNLAGIFINEGVNNDKQPPIITSYSGTTITGTSQPNDIIEIFGSIGNENANEYLGSTTTDANGNWTTTVASNSWEYAVATATDGSGNSSTFSTKSVQGCFGICLLPDQRNSPISYPYPSLDICDSEEICLGESVTFQISRVCAANEFFAYFEFNGAYTNDTYTFDYVGTDGYYNIFQFTFTPSQSGTFEVIPHLWQYGPYNSAGTFNLIVNPGPDFYIDENTTFCEGSSATLTALGSTSYSYLWSNGSTAQSTTVTQPGIYTITATSANGCTKTESIEVFQDPSPDITISGNINICQGQSTTLTATGGYSYYHWSNGINSSSITVSQPGTYTVTVTNIYGCTSTASVTVIQNPNLNITISGNNNICYGSYTTLTATSGYSNYLWSNGQTTQSISVNPLVNTNYSITVTSTQGCTGSSTIAVTVNSNPTASISPATSTICAGATATLTASNGASYLWSTGAITASITVNPSTTTIYTVTVTNAAGCTATANRLVTVNALPTASISPATSTICAGASATLTASGGGTYLWSTNIATATITVSPASTTTYTVTVTSAAGCKATASRTVTVNALPTADITGNTTICSGASTQLTATGGTSYSWSTGSTNQIIAVSPYNSTTYTVTVTNANGCSATDNIFINVNNFNVTISPSNPQVCAGSSIILTASSSVNYLWSNGATTSSITVSPLANTSYSITATGTNGCTGGSKVNVSVIPVPSITLESTNAICDNIGTATVSSVLGNPPFSYLWSNGSNTQSITGLSEGSYSVTVTDYGGCSTTANVTITYDCCNSDCEIYLENGDNANDLMAQNSGSTTVENKKICINGTFIIANDLHITFNNCTVKMGDDAKIYVSKGHLIIDKTIIKACNNKLWNMILVDHAGSKVIIRNNSIISDGKDALMSDYNGRFEIDNSIFKKNINAVHVIHFSGKIQLSNITKTLFSGGTLINQTQAQKGVFLEKGNEFIFGEKNRYEYLQYGIYAKSVVRLLSQYKSNFKNNFTGIDYRNTSTQNSSTLHLNNADMIACTNGVVTQYVKSQIQIKYNKFNYISNNAIEITDNRNCDISYNSQMNKIGGTAIKVQNVNIGSAYQTISNNVITNTKNGIQAINLEAVNISYNNISIKAQQSANNYNNGISLEGCKTMNVNYNTINGNNVWAWWQRGISSQNSTASLINTNTINGAGKSIEFGGNSTNGKMQCNTMNNAGNGLFLAYSWGLPPQGDPSSCTVNDNQWTGAFAEGHTHCYYSFGEYSPFYVRDDGGASYIPSNNWKTPNATQDPYNYLSSIIDVTSMNGCNSPCSNAKSLIISDFEMEYKIASNSIQYNINPEANKWLAQYYVYNKILDNSDILNVDTVFTHFFDSISNTNIAKIVDINRLLNDTLLDSTKIVLIAQLNNLIIPQNTIELNHKTVNSILISSYQLDTINNFQLDELKSIAIQCPFTDGNAVYGARVLLSTIDTNIYNNECETIYQSQSGNKSLTDTQNNLIKSDLSVFVFPNPAKDELSIKYNESLKGAKFLLYNLLGEIVLSYTLNAENYLQKISLSNIISGVYYYKITSLENKNLSDKIVIIK